MNLKRLKRFKPIEHFLMNINRHNYEEYFLLFADNELSATERNMVEGFLAANPDLQEEMLMLQDTILQPEQVLFDNKENLLKPQPLDAGIQQQLLLLLDNELEAGEKQTLQLLTTNDEAVRKEWNLLKQTKLAAADIIIFPGKADLYEKEEGKVVGFIWWRMAAAAMLIGFGLWGAVSYLNKNIFSVPSTETASDNNKSVKPVDDTNGVAVPVPSLPETAAPEKEMTATVAATDNNTSIILPGRPLVPGKKLTPEALPKKLSNEMVLQQKDKNLPQPNLENLNNPGSNNTDFANVPPQKKDIGNATSDIDPAENNITEPATYAVNTAFADNNDSNNHFASFDEEEEDKPRKTRVGGFFKKVKRVLERKANIKTGNGDNIKIANMSFAMH